MLTAAHNVDYRQVLGDDEKLLVRTIEGSKLTAGVVLVCDEPSGVDLALLEINDPRFDEDLPPVIFARVDRDSPAPVTGCWAVGFPRFGEAGPVLPGGSNRETWEVGGEIWPGAKLRAGLLALQVTSTPQPLPTSLAGSAWEGMSGAVVFTTDPHGGELAVGVISTHHRPEGESALTVVPMAAVAGLPTAAEWWHQLGVADPDTLPVLPPLSAAAEQRSRLAGELALKEHWDPRGRGVERAARPGWFFTGRRQALSQLVAWLTAAPDPDDNVRVVTGGPGSGKSAVLARLVTMSDPRYRAGMPAPLAPGDPVASLPLGAIDVAVHARTASAAEVVSALAAAAGAPQADLDGLINRLLERPEAFTIAVDALDEADDPRALAQALRRLASETAEAGVRLLVGTRPGGPDRRLITDLGLSTRDDDPALIDLDTPAYLSRDDLAEYVRRRLLLTGVPPAPGRPDTPYRGRETLAGQVADAVARAAYPTFLIGQLVSRALLLRDQPISPHDPGWQQFPKTVAEAMDQYLDSVGDQAEQDRVEDLLRPLAYARGDGLPLDDAGLWPLLATALARPGRRYTAGDVDRLLDTAADYLVETVITGQAAYYRLYHQALSDRLRERDQQHPRPVSAAQTIYECLLGTVARRPDGTRDWPTAHPYLHSHLAGHAAAAGVLDQLLQDPGYLAAADPDRLMVALPSVTGSATRLARGVYRRAFDDLRSSTAPERSSYLELAARQAGADDLAEQFSRAEPSRPWSTRWAFWRPQVEHFIARRHLGWVSALAKAECNGRPVVASAGDDREVAVWNVSDGVLALPPLRGANAPLYALAVSSTPETAVIVAASKDGTLHAWTLDEGRRLRWPDPLPVAPDSLYALAPLAIGETPAVVAAGADGVLRVIDVRSGERVGPAIRAHAAPVTAVAVTELRGAPVIVSASSDCSIRFWDLDGHEVMGPLRHDDAVTALAVPETTGEPLLVSGSRDQSVRCWAMSDAGVRSCWAEPGAHRGWIRALWAGSLTGTGVVVSAGADRELRVWDVERGLPLGAPLVGHDGWVSAVVIVPDPEVIVSAGQDGTARVWHFTAEPAADQAWRSRRGRRRYRRRCPRPACPVRLRRTSGGRVASRCGNR